jgi:hypothetical protein
MNRLDLHYTKLSEIRSENPSDSGHMTELKTEVDNCKKIIKFLETEIGCKNDIINKLLENNRSQTLNQWSDTRLNTVDHPVHF